MTPRLGVLLVCGALLACDTGPGSVRGAIAGIELRVRDALFYEIPACTPAGCSAVGPTRVVLVMTDVPDYCRRLKARREPREATRLELTFGRFSEAETPLEVQEGDYTAGKVVSAADYVTGQLVRTNEQCQDTMDPNAAQPVSGILHVGSIDARRNGASRGSFDLTFGAQKDQVTGSFYAVYCEVPTTIAPPSCE